MAKIIQFHKTDDKLSQKFLHSIRLLLLQSKIFGFITFNETTFEPSKLHSFLNFLAVVAYLPAISYSVYSTAIYDTLLIYKATDIMILAGNVVYMVTAWVCATTKRDLFVDFLVKVIEFDAQLQAMGTRMNYTKWQKKILVQCLVRHVIVVANVGTLVYITLPKGSNMVVESMAYVLIMMNSVICHQTGELVLMLKARFTILNKLILSLVDRFKKSGARTSKQSNVEHLLTLSKICALHHHLSKLVRLFNDAFGLILLLMFAVSFVIIVISIFYLNVVLKTSVFYAIDVFNPLLANVTFVMNVVYICDACYSTIEEVKRTGELIHRIDTEDCDIRDEIEMFSLQIANEEVEFNAAGFFSINYTLIFSIIGGVTTYIIILIQLSNSIAEDY
ncbi:hypothetical protein Zmor_019358 [Zophobas morio]|uniref:Gustatory receptor n=1 Tax=Zophobas morio TaxID=2755281 RepID=A0AA38M8P7_9CUCU|nr:hypothetical protein Zmor_019358 [Zophobas morio]